MGTVRSAHLEMTIEAAGQHITAEGDETVHDGTATAMTMDETLPDIGTLSMVIVHGALYVKLPKPLNPTDKPWVHVLPNTTNPMLKPMAAALEDVQKTASVSRFETFARAADDVRFHGSEDVGGGPADHYSLAVVVDRLPASFPNIDALRRSGIDRLPIDLWTDGKGRVVRLTEQLTVLGQQTSTEMTLGNFDAPVTVTAPPKDQVATA
jgi:hypothetical protein